MKDNYNNHENTGLISQTCFLFQSPKLSPHVWFYVAQNVNKELHSLFHFTGGWHLGWVEFKGNFPISQNEPFPPSVLSCFGTAENQYALVLFLLPHLNPQIFSNDSFQTVQLMLETHKEKIQKTAG